MDEKPGYKSTEFWTKNAVQALIVAGALAHRGIDERTATLIVCGLEAAYMAARVALKALRGVLQAVLALKNHPPTPVPPLAPPAA